LDFGCEPLLSRLNPGEHRPLEPWLGSLSDTETVLVSLARAMVGGPRLLLLDGVLDQLPPSYRERVCRQLFRSDAPWTLIVTTHDPAIAAMCTQTFELVR
jgi:ABC-type molybdenum transport system ATPase subunit/photorepair protein PhrA